MSLQNQNCQFQVYWVVQIKAIGILNEILEKTSKSQKILKNIKNLVKIIKIWSVLENHQEENVLSHISQNRLILIKIHWNYRRNLKVYFYLRDLERRILYLKSKKIHLKYQNIKNLIFRKIKKIRYFLLNKLRKIIISIIFKEINGNHIFFQKNKDILIKGHQNTNILHNLNKVVFWINQAFHHNLNNNKIAFMRGKFRIIKKGKDYHHSFSLSKKDIGER